MALTEITPTPEEARNGWAEESAALDQKRERWETDEAGGAATIERLEARVAELEAEAREVARQRAAIAELRGRL
jgi:hypothetical protein